MLTSFLSLNLLINSSLAFFSPYTFYSILLIILSPLPLSLSFSLSLSCNLLKFCLYYLPLSVLFLPQPSLPLSFIIPPFPSLFLSLPLSCSLSLSLSFPLSLYLSISLSLSLYLSLSVSLCLSLCLYISHRPLLSPPNDQKRSVQLNLVSWLTSSHRPAVSKDAWAHLAQSERDVRVYLILQNIRSIRWDKTQRCTDFSQT